MRGAGTINTPSYLPMLYGIGAPGDSLLASLHKRNETAALPADPLDALDTARRDAVKQIALTAQRPDVKRDLARYHRALVRAGTASEFLGHPTALKVLLTAHGLEDQAGNRNLAVKALLSDPASPDALVTRLADTRWRTMARRCAFVTEGLAVLRDPVTGAAIPYAYAEAMWWRLLDRTVPGIARALDFLKRAGTIEETDQVMGDPTFRAVVLTTPDPRREIAFRGLSAQRMALANRIDIARFRDPDHVWQCARRYVLAATAEASLNAAGAADDLDTSDTPPARVAI